jgi:hypothetical protein
VAVRAEQLLWVLSSSPDTIQTVLIMAGFVSGPTIAGCAEVAVCQVILVRIAFATKTSWGSHGLKGLEIIRGMQFKLEVKVLNLNFKKVIA